jgi:hypothetical protein
MALFFPFATSAQHTPSAPRPSPSSLATPTGAEVFFLLLKVFYGRAQDKTRRDIKFLIYDPILMADVIEVSVSHSN